MASQTQNYHYPKPEEEDFYDVGEFNRAMDMIDEDIKQVEEAIPAAVRVKGAAESSYRTGDVNITPENIGLGNVPNVSTNNQIPTFTQASGRVNIGSGERLSVIFGKIMKWFADLKTVAFSGKYTDLTDKPTIPAAVRVKGNAESAYRTGDVNLTAENIGAAKQSLVGAEITDIYGHTNIQYSYVDKNGSFHGMSSAESLTEALKDATEGTSKGVEELWKKFDGFIKTGTFGLTYPGKYTLIGNKIVFASIEYCGSGMPEFNLSELYGWLRRVGVSEPYPHSGNYGIFDIDIRVIHKTTNNTWECGIGYLNPDNYNKVCFDDNISSYGTYLVNIKYVLP